VGIAEWTPGDRVEVISGTFATFQGTVVPPDLTSTVAVFSTEPGVVAFVRLEVYEGRPIVPCIATNLRRVDDGPTGVREPRKPPGTSPDEGSSQIEITP
jgi:hypothetical protein